MEKKQEQTIYVLWAFDRGMSHIEAVSTSERAIKQIKLNRESEMDMFRYCTYVIEQFADPKWLLETGNNFNE